MFIYDNGPDYLSEGLFRIENKRNGKIGFADMQGNIIILPTYFHASPFKNGIAKVTKVGKKEKVGEYTIITNGEWGLINKKGNYSGTLFLTNDEECRRVVNILL